MSADNELTPQQEFDKILSSAAVDIARMEQVRDAPGRPGSPAPKPEPPPGTPPGNNTGARPPADKAFQDNAIANRKADTLKEVDRVSSKVSPEEKKEMQDRAYSTLYPKDKNDLNQIPKNPNPRDKEGKHMGDKEVDNAQERANFLRGKKASKDQDKKKDTEVDKSQDRAEELRSKDTNKDDPAAVKSDGKSQENKPDKEQGKDVKNPSQDKGKSMSMGAQFKQSLEGNKGQAKDAKSPSQNKGKSMSMGAQFKQSLEGNKSSPSPTTRSSPSPSAPGSGGGESGGGSRGSGSSPGGRGD
jgi:hypothetical protein